MVVIETLTEKIIDIGKELLSKVRAKKTFEINTAFWMFNEENSYYELWIVSPSVKKEGLFKLYDEIEHMLTPEQRIYFNSSNIKICNPDHPTAKNVVEIRNRFTHILNGKNEGWSLRNIERGLYIYL